MLQQNLVIGSYWFAIGLKSDLWIDVLDLPDRVNSIVQHPAGLLLSRLSGTALWGDMGTVQKQRLISVLG